MSYKTRRLFFCALVLGAFFVVNLTTVWACSCGPTPTVLDSYEGANLVIIAKAVAVEKAAAESSAVDGIASTTFTVEKVYKGNVKVGNEVTLLQGGGADCIWTFEEGDIGKEYLFYLYSNKKNPKVWVAVACGRSRGLKGAADDLSYLDNMDKVHGKTRISGRLTSWDNLNFSLAGRTIRIIGEKKVYEVKTDGTGFYEIYDLPAGKYVIKPELPNGWQVDDFSLSYSPSLIKDLEEESKEPVTQIPILLEANKHASLDIYLEFATTIRGKVFDPVGKPMEGVCLRALEPTREKQAYYYADCTDANGAFFLNKLLPGDYILAVNSKGKISSAEPFPTFFYPNVAEREKAAVLHIAEGETLDNINIHVQKMAELITINGLLLYSDGKPVAGKSVYFIADKIEGNIDGNTSTTSDELGRFSLTLLKDVPGSLHGSMYTYVGEFTNCPRLDALIKKTGKTIGEIKTAFLPLQTNLSLNEIKLQFPFPSCKRAEERREDR